MNMGIDCRDLKSAGDDRPERSSLRVLRIGTNWLRIVYLGIGDDIVGGDRDRLAFLRLADGEVLKITRLTQESPCLFI
jgi:hypothetical protein